MTLIELDTTVHPARRCVDATTASAYLAFGHVPATDLRDRPPVPATEAPTLVGDADDLIDALVERLPRPATSVSCSAAIPASALLAALLPPTPPATRCASMRRERSTRHASPPNTPCTGVIRISPFGCRGAITWRTPRP